MSNDDERRGEARRLTKIVHLKNATVALDDTGDGDAVLLLHGFPATRRLWSRVAPSLTAAGFRVLVPDLVGYGDSHADAGLRVDMAHQAHWLLELLDAMGIERAAVVAHDVGSAAAQLLVVRAPHRVRGLAVLDGVCGREWAMQAIESIQKWPAAEAHRLFAVLARRLGKTPGMREMLAAYAGEDGGLRLIRAAQDLDPGQTETIGESLRGSKVPALVLWGAHDQYLPIDGVARPLAELLEAPLILLPGGHFTPLDCPEPVTEALQKFLAGLSPGIPAMSPR